MRIPYYEKKSLRQVEIESPCPGCGKINNLAMHDRVESYMHDRTEYFIGCNCGWHGPSACSPTLAAVKWDARNFEKEFYMGKGKKDIPICIRLSLDEKAAAEKLADHLGIGLSGLIRLSLHEKIDQVYVRTFTHSNVETLTEKEEG